MHGESRCVLPSMSALPWLPRHKQPQEAKAALVLLCAGITEKFLHDMHKLKVNLSVVSANSNTNFVLYWVAPSRPVPAGT